MRNTLSPRKLLLSKWTAVAPVERQKHFLVTRVIQTAGAPSPIEWVEIEAVHSRVSSRMRWRDLTDVNQWRQGWV